MDVRVAGHQVDTGETLRENAQRRIAEITEKYFSRSVGANVTFGRGPNNDFTCDIVAPVAQGVVLKATHSGREAEMALNGAADRIEKQLRRYAERLKEHKVDEADQAYVENAGYTIFSPAPMQRRARPIMPGDRCRNACRIPDFQRVGRRDADGPSQHARAPVQEQRDRASST